MDKINGDVRAGEFLMLDEWHGAKAFVKSVVTAIGRMTVSASEGEEGASPNVAYVGDVLEILAVDYPNAIVRVHASCGHSAQTHLDLREFTCHRATPEYIAAVVKKAATAPAPAVIPPPAKVAWWRRLLRRVSEL
jgi:hypothetical protein